MGNKRQRERYKVEEEVQDVGMQGYACVLLQSCQALPERAKDKGEERRAGKMRDECPDQGFSNKRGTTQPLLASAQPPVVTKTGKQGTPRFVNPAVIQQ